MQAVREAAANAAASAKAGVDKTKATVQEKVEKMSAHDQVEKEMATERKEHRKAEAEANKQAAHDHNAASKQAAKAGVVTHPQYTTAGESHPTTHVESLDPNYGTGTMPPTRANYL